jgi:signal transduction histidine kinase
MPPSRIESAGARLSESTDFLSRLAAHKTVGKAPQEELAWLATHGSLRQMTKGEVLSKRGASVEALYIVLSGRFALQVDRGAGRHKVAEWQAGDVTGLLPYSRLLSPPGDVVAEEPSELLVVDRDDLPAMIRECHALTSTLVHVMVDRARHFTSSELHDEKLISLGKLAAGLAHELNNPAAAIRRSAKLFSDSVAAAEAGSRALGRAGLTEAEFAMVSSLRDACLARPTAGVRSPLEQREREDAIADWLVDHGCDDSISDALAETPLALESLDRFAGAVRRETLEAVLRWVAADCSVRQLANEIEQAAARISDLVASVKGFTQVDQSPVPQQLEISRGLMDTVAVLKGKARKKAISVEIQIDDHLPAVRAVPGELNQIWANIIDNALDAAPHGGRVEVTAHTAPGHVIVSVVDDGPGMAPAVRDRIFDPFFTTKDVGQGTGLGLDIVRRLVQRHDGAIEVHSVPGRTEFRVSLPIEGSRSRQEQER